MMADICIEATFMREDGQNVICLTSIPEWLAKEIDKCRVVCKTPAFWDYGTAQSAKYHVDLVFPIEAVEEELAADGEE